MKRTFIYTDEKSSKFWSIITEGNQFTVNYGKTGTAGQTQTKEFTSEAECQKQADKLIAEKIKKGYIEQATAQNEQIKIQKTTPQKEVTTTQVTEKLPKIIEGCSVDIIRNGRVVEYTSVMINWDPYDKAEDPGGILIRGNKMYYKVMPTPELAIIDGLRIIADKLSGGNKFSTCKILVEGEKVEVSEEQLNEWINIATENGKYKKAFFNPEKPGDVNKYVDAIKNGDLEQVKKFVENGANIRRIKQAKNDVYSMKEAIKANQPEMVRFFAEKLNSFEISDYGYSYFTSIATKTNNEDTVAQVNLLLNNGYDLKKDPCLASKYTDLLLNDDLLQKVLDAIDLSDDNGNVLCEALANNNNKEEKLKRILQLINKGANVKDTTESDKRTPLHNAVLKYGTNLNLIQLLVEKGADPNATDHWDKTPLEVAIVDARPSWSEEVSPEVFEYLYKVTTNYKPGIFDIIYSETLKDKFEIAKLLLNKNTDYNTKNKDGYTPLQYAKLRKASKELVEFIESQTTTPEISNETILHVALDTMQSDELMNGIRQALENNANPNAVNENGDTFLHRLMDMGDNFWKYGGEFIEKALKNGANINAQNKKGLTPLMYAVTRRTLEFVEKLINAGADVNMQDNEGNTATHYSKHHCLLPLIQAKPNVLLANKAGLTAIDHIRNSGGYYTDGHLYDHQQAVKLAIDALGLNLPTDQQQQGVSWTTKAIELDKTLPEKFTEVSSYYFPYNDASDVFIHLGNNYLALVGGHPRKIQIFDTLKGKIVWGLNSAGRNGFAIYDKEKEVIYVARDGSSSANYITAHKPETGEPVWKKECKLTNSSQQFGTVFVQNESHVIHANIRKDNLFFVNKQTGKLDAKINMQHSICCGADFTDAYDKHMFTQNNYLYVMGYNWDKSFFTVDKYDINTQSFVATIFSANQGIALSTFVEGENCVYLFADSGVMYKISLADGKLLNKIVHDPEGKEEPQLHRIKKLEEENGKLKYTLTGENDTYLYFEYDVSTDKLTALKSTPFKKLPETKNLEYGKKKWITIKQLVLGNALFEIQKEAWKMGSENCFLHRLS